MAEDGFTDNEDPAPNVTIWVIVPADEVFLWVVGQTVQIRGAKINQSFTIASITQIPQRPLIRFAVELANSGHLPANDFDDTPHTAFTEFEVLPSPVGDEPTINWLGAISEGPITNVYHDTIEINGVNISSFPGVEAASRLGTTPQAPLTFPQGGTRSTFAVGSEIELTPAVSYTTTIPVTGFSLNIDFNNGIYRLNTETGRFEVNGVRLDYRFREAAGTFGDFTRVEMAGDSVTPVRLAIRKLGLPLANYVIEIQFVDADSDNPTKAGFTPTLTSVTEINESIESYDGTALLQLAGIKPNQLAQKSLDNITVVVDGLAVEEGSFTGTPHFSRNPAWICMHLLRTYMNVPTTRIDLAAFTTWALEADQLVRTFIPGLQRNRKKYQHALIVANPAREQTVVQELVTHSRVEMLRAGGQWSPRLLKDDVPLQMYSSANVFDLVVTSQLDDEEINVIQIQFNDENNNWDRATLAWPPKEDWPTEPNILEINADGVTHPSAIQAMAEWELNKRQVLHDHIRFKTTEAPRLQKYDLFRFSHEQQGWGDAGRVSDSPNNSTTNIVLDHGVDYVLANDPYHVYVRHPSGVIDQRTVTTQGGDTTLDELPLASALSATPEADTTIWAYGRTGPPDTAVLTFRCLDLTYDETTRHYTVDALEHIASIYDDATPTPPSTITSLPDTQGPPPSLVNLNALANNSIGPSGQSISVVVLSWGLDPDQRAVSPRLSPYDGAYIHRRTILSNAALDVATLDTAELDQLLATSELGGPSVWVLIGESTQGRTVYEDFTVQPAASYQYRVTPFSTQRTLGTPAFVGIKVLGSLDVAADDIPETPQNLRVLGQVPAVTTFEGPNIMFEWDAASNSTQLLSTGLVKDYKIEIWGTDSQSNLSYRLHPRIGDGARHVGSTSFNYDHHINQEDSLVAGQSGPVRKVTIRVWARTQQGILSAVAAQKTVDNAVPSMASVTPTIDPLVEALIVKWDTFVPPRDLESYRVLVDTFTPPRTVGAAYDETVSPAVTLAIVSNLVAGTTYYTQIIPADTFGVGVGSAIASDAPNMPAQQFSFFVRGFARVTGLVFTGSVETVSWTSGTMTYTDGTGETVASQSIDAGNGTRNTAGSHFVYYILGESIFRSTDQLALAFRSDRTIIAVYNGGSTVDEVWGAKMSGTDLIAQTIGAANLVTGTAVITESAQIADLVVDTSQIQNLAVGTGQLAASAVTNAKLAALAVDTSELAANAVTAAKIEASTITNAEIAANTVRAAEIEALTITAAELASDSVETSKLAALSVTTAKIAALAVGAAQIANLAVGTGQLAASAVTNAKLAALAVDTSELAANAVTAAKIEAATITNAEIAANTIRAAEIEALTITAAELASDSVETPKLAALSVTTAKIAALAVGAAQIQNLAIGTAQLGTDAVTNAKLAALAVGTSELATDAVTAAKILASTITNAEIAANTIRAAEIEALTITAAELASDSVETPKLAALSVTTAKIAALAVGAAQIANAAIETAKIGDLNVTTIKVADNAITSDAVSSLDAAESVTDTEETLASVSLSVTSGLGYNIIWIKCNCSLDVLEECTVRIREDSLTGTIIDQTTVRGPVNSAFNSIEVVNVGMALYIPDATETKSFFFTAQASTGDTIVTTDAKIIAQYVRK